MPVPLQLIKRLQNPRTSWSLDFRHRDLAAVARGDDPRFQHLHGLHAVAQVRLDLRTLVERGQEVCHRMGEFVLVPDDVTGRHQAAT